MAKTIASKAARAESSIAWNDIEALPIYAAILMAAGLIWFALLETMPDFQAHILKAVGIFGCVALRHAWLKLDQNGSGSD